MTPALAFLIFIVGMIVYVYGILTPLANLVQSLLLKLGAYVIGRRKHTCIHGECNGVGVHCGYSDCDGHV